MVESRAIEIMVQLWVLVELQCSVYRARSQKEGQKNTWVGTNSGAGVDNEVESDEAEQVARELIKTRHACLFACVSAVQSARREGAR